jgi:hypothetical protein
MTTMKRLAVLATFLFLSHSAYADFYFGRDESLILVEDVRAQGPDGEDLQISRLVVRQNFLLPFNVSDGGLVLSIKGEQESYIPWPDASSVRELQQAGLLPTPLPDSALSTLDKVLGYALWESLLVLLAWSWLGRLFRK